MPSSAWKKKLHLEVKPLMTLTTVLYLSCALISGHLAMMLMELTFFFNDTATTEIYTLSLHDALPICHPERRLRLALAQRGRGLPLREPHRGNRAGRPLRRRSAGGRQGPRPAGGLGEIGRASCRERG